MQIDVRWWWRESMAGIVAIPNIMTLPVQTIKSDQYVMETITDSVPFNENWPIEWL